MELTDARLRLFIYDWLIAHGSAPSSEQIGEAFSESAGSIRARMAALKIGKTVLVHPRTGEIWMAGPFAAESSEYRLTDGTTTWFANCAWDMYGVAVIIGRALDAVGPCVDCGETLAVRCDPQRPPTEEGVVHFLLPARRWYDDIGFT
jgi:hypothetical protein